MTFQSTKSALKKITESRMWFEISEAIAGAAFIIFLAGTIFFGLVLGPA